MARFQVLHMILESTFFSKQSKEFCCYPRNLHKRNYVILSQDSLQHTWELCKWRKSKYQELQEPVSKENEFDFLNFGACFSKELSSGDRSNMRARPRTMNNRGEFNIEEPRIKEFKGNGTIITRMRFQKKAMVRKVARKGNKLRIVPKRNKVARDKKWLFADIEIERYIHMDMGKEVDLESLKKMSLDYVMAKELAIKGAEKVIDTRDINHIAENQTLIGDVVRKTIADWNIHKETFYQRTGLSKRQVITNQEWKEITFNLDLTDIKQQRISSESMDGGITESMNQPGIKEDIHCKKSKLEGGNNQKYDQTGLKEDHNNEGGNNQKMINMDIMKITATKVEVTGRNKDDLSGYKNDHNHYKKSMVDSTRRWIKKT
nr:hypothetical protein [Tanacetum cinerariifolium]